MFNFYTELAKGGWVMVPIGLVSVLSLGLFLERVFTLRRSRVFPSAFIERVRALIRGGHHSEALVLCQRDASSMALIVSAGLLQAHAPRERIKEAVEERGRLEAGRLDRFLEGLGTIAAIAPLLGLLGTVLGMIDVFKEVDASTRSGVMGVNPGALASGIWKALITTAAGLTVAIPTFVGYKYLGTRVNRLVLDLEEGATELLDLLAPGAANVENMPPVGGAIAAETPAGAATGSSQAARHAVPGAGPESAGSAGAPKTHIATATEDEPTPHNLDDKPRAQDDPGESR
ncbi:MAG: MotA/TolQ/ExbB proton channel family protein [Polyangia bacterium]|nr:MotA/TolQ/ExbB proton channel family protein [Polyangia bacterium]